MTDGGAAFQAGMEEAEVPFRPRGTYAGYRVFGSGDGAVLIKPEVTRELRSAAESATQERRVTGGLLYGRGWADEQGRYLVIDGYLEAGPGENRGDRITADGFDRFTLSEADLRLLREDADRMYTSEIEVGWWRSLAVLGEFGPQDFETQAELVGPGGVGLLVYGSSSRWGTAYLGPDGLAPDSAGTLVTAVDPGGAAPGPVPGPGPAPEAGADTGAGPEVVDITAPRRRMTRPRASAQVGTTARRWAVRRAAADGPPETPADVQFVVVALSVVIVAAAIIVGVLVHSVLVAVIIAAVGLLVVFSTVWFSRR
jgi:hypothetical protein